MCKKLEEVRFVTEIYEIGRNGTDFNDDEFDWKLLFLPGGSSVCSDLKAGSADYWMLDRIAATLNSEPDGPDTSLPATDPNASLRMYFLPYSDLVCELKDRQEQKLLPDYFELLRQPRIPLSGWYLGDTGYRELLDTNFGEGHRVPVQKAGNTWVLFIASRLSATDTQPFQVTLDYSKHKREPLRWEN